MSTPDDRQHEDEFTIDNQFDEANQTLEAILAMESAVREAGEVDRMTMESLHRMEPLSINRNFPVQSFTKMPSQHNLNVSLESFDVAKFLAFAAVGAALGGAILFLVKLLRNNKVSAKVDELEKKIEENKEVKEEVKDAAAEAKKADLDPQAQRELRELENVKKVDKLVEDIKPDTPNTKKFVQALAPNNGEVFTRMVALSKHASSHFHAFQSRLKVLVDLIDRMYSPRNEADIAAMIKQAQDIQRKRDDDFDVLVLTHMRSAWNRATSDVDDFKAFMQAEIVGTRSWYDFVFNDASWLNAVARITPYRHQSLDSGIDDMEKNAARLIDSKKHANELAKKTFRDENTTVDGNRVVMRVKGVNANLQREIHIAEQSIRQEITAFRYYRMYLNRMLEYYKHCLSVRNALYARQRNAIRALAKGKSKD